MTTRIVCWLLTSAAASAAVVVDSRTTSNAAGQVTTVAVERGPDLAGRAVQWRQTTEVSTPVKEGVTEINREVKERNARGELQTAARQAITVEQTPTGQVTKTAEYLRNAADKLQPSRQSTVTEQKAADGTIQSTRVDKVPNINGEWQTQREERSTTRVVNPNETVTENRIQTFDRVAGAFGLTAIETTKVRTAGDLTVTETVVVRPTSGGGDVTGKTVTTATKAADGTVQSETVEYGLPLGTAVRPLAQQQELRPRQKVVEKLVANPDGTQTRERQTYRYTVNNEWQPVTVVPTN